MNKVYLVLGSIGSGKSVISDFLLSHQEFSQIEYIGSDAYKKKYFDSQGEKKKRGYRCADELVFARMEQVCLSGQDFLFELCPTNLNKIRTLKSICSNVNYQIVSFFIGTNNVNINVSRCKARESAGGDTVDETKIKKRYFEALTHILELLRMSETMYFVDNSNEIPLLVASILGDKIHVFRDNCTWFNNYVTAKLI